jgi:hypothetical protein
MDGQWEVIYRCSNAYKAEILRALLEDNEIQSVVINKKDSSYLIGDIELYVKQHDVLTAKQIVNKFERNE